jgi:hypothetical protein
MTSPCFNNIRCGYLYDLFIDMFNYDNLPYVARLALLDLELDGKDASHA